MEKVYFQHRLPPGQITQSWSQSIICNPVQTLCHNLVNTMRQVKSYVCQMEIDGWETELATQSLPLFPLPSHLIPSSHHLIRVFDFAILQAPADARRRNAFALVFGIRDDLNFNPQLSQKRRVALSTFPESPVLSAKNSLRPFAPLCG